MNVHPQPLLVLSGSVLRRCSGMATVRLEESEPVASPGGWTMTVTINQMEQTPGGSTTLLRSENYNFKQGAADESTPDRVKRLDVKRGARRRCLDKFDSIKRQQQLAQRRAARQGRVAAKAGADTAACVRVAARTLTAASTACLPIPCPNRTICRSAAIGLCSVHGKCCRRLMPCLNRCARPDLMMMRTRGRYPV